MTTVQRPIGFEWDFDDTTRHATASMMEDRESYHCPECTGLRYRETLAAHLLIRGGSEWPLMMSTTTNSAAHVLREDIVQVAERERWTGVKFLACTLRSFESKKLSVETMPTYYLPICSKTVNVVDIDLEASGANSEITICTTCQFAYVKPELRASYQDRSATRIVLAHRTEPLPDVFQLRNYGIPNLFCSMRVVEAARREKWKRMVFQTTGLLRRNHPGRRLFIDYLGKQWPPELFPEA